MTQFNGKNLTTSFLKDLTMSLNILHDLMEVRDTLWLSKRLVVEVAFASEKVLLKSWFDLQSLSFSTTTVLSTLMQNTKMRNHDTILLAQKNCLLFSKRFQETHFLQNE
jgi:hypothetical protein